MTLDEAKDAIRRDPYRPRDATEEQIDRWAQNLLAIVEGRTVIVVGETGIAITNLEAP